MGHPAFVFSPSLATSSGSGQELGLGIVLGLGSAMMAAAQFVMVGAMKRDCHWLQVEQATASLSVLVFCPLAAATLALFGGIRISDSLLDLDALPPQRVLGEVVLGVLGFVASALLTRAAQLGSPSRCAICLYLEVPFVYVGQIYGAEDTSSGARKGFVPGPVVFLGMFLVSCAVLAHIMRAKKAAEGSAHVVKNNVTDDYFNEKRPLMPARDIVML